MIREITDIDQFDEAAAQWNNKLNKRFWKMKVSSSRHFRFNPNSIHKNLRSSFVDGLMNPSKKEKIKLWSYYEGEKSIAGCVFFENYNFLLGQTCLQEVLWQLNGKFANRFKEIKILKQLLETAENYAVEHSIDSICISRDPKLHAPFKYESFSIKNNYTKKDYHPMSIFYIKYLK
jgi:hypothetical protein